MGSGMIGESVISRTISGKEVSGRVVGLLNQVEGEPLLYVQKDNGRHEVCFQRGTIRVAATMFGRPIFWVNDLGKGCWPILESQP